MYSKVPDHTIYMYLCWLIWIFSVCIYSEDTFSYVAAQIFIIFLETPSSTSVTHRQVDWDFPSSEMEKLRYKVFRELWEQGYYLTSGSKFGGDFLVYPGKIFCRSNNIFTLNIHNKQCRPRPKFHQSY